MVSYGVTTTGFVRKDYNIISESIDARLIHLFGEKIDLTPGNPIKNIADLCTIELSKLWIEAERVYNSAFIETAVGYNLDSIGTLAGITRLAGTPATGQVLLARYEVLTGGARLIPAGTEVSTAIANPITYLTTESIYFEPLITGEVYPAQTGLYTEFDAINRVGEIVSIIGSDVIDYTVDATFNGRTITVASSIPIGVSLTISYKPLSVEVNIQSTINSASSNVNVGGISEVVSDIAFIHYVENETALINGIDTESDNDLRIRTLNATLAIGNATKASLDANLRNVTGVTNVIVSDVYLVSETDIVVSDGSTSITVPETPVYSITSVTGASTGVHTVTDIDEVTGELTLGSSPNVSEDVTIVYTWEDVSNLNGGLSGRVKIFVSGGIIGDTETPDTILYTIEQTRAAGVQSIGYGTEFTNAYGDNDYPYAWFYRIAEAFVDITIEINYKDDSQLTPTEKDDIHTSIVTKLTTFINSIDLNETLWKNKVLQIAISENVDIENAVTTTFELNDVEGGTYLIGSASELISARTIIVAED